MGSPLLQKACRTEGTRTQRNELFCCHTAQVAHCSCSCAASPGHCKRAAQNLKLLQQIDLLCVKREQLIGKTFCVTRLSCERRARVVLGHRTRRRWKQWRASATVFVETSGGKATACEQLCSPTESRWSPKPLLISVQSIKEMLCVLEKMKKWTMSTDSEASAKASCDENWKVSAQINDRHTNLTCLASFSCFHLLLERLFLKPWSEAHI